MDRASHEFCTLKFGMRTRHEIILARFRHGPVCHETCGSSRIAMPTFTLPTCHSDYKSFGPLHVNQLEFQKTYTNS